MSNGRPVTTGNYPKIHIRVPPDLYEKLIESANKDLRPLNSEVILRLLRSYDETEKEQV